MVEISVTAEISDEKNYFGGWGVIGPLRFRVHYFHISSQFFAIGANSGIFNSSKRSMIYICDSQAKRRGLNLVTAKKFLRATFKALKAPLEYNLRKSRENVFFYVSPPSPTQKKGQKKGQFFL